MTFGPITVNRPGSSATVGIMGPVGKTGTPGTNGAPGPQGPAVFTPIAAWVSGLTYAPGTATQAASYVSVGGSSYACTTLHTSGVFAADLAAGLWEPVALQGAQGNPGTPGSTWYSGLGAPSPSIGINGDYFLRTDTYDVLLKVSGAWSKIGNIQGLAGNTIQNGTGAPPNSLGANGDFYLDTTSTAPRIFGPKVNGAWLSSGISLIGSGAGSVNPTGSFTSGNLVVSASSDGKTVQDGGRPGYVVVDTPTSPYTSVNRDEVWWNTASTAVMQLLPASPVAGTRVRALRSGTNTVTVGQNGNPIAGTAADLVLDQDKTGVELIWDANLTTWLVTLIQHA